MNEEMEVMESEVEESVNEEVADLEENNEEVAEEGAKEEVEVAEPQSKEQNAFFANMRRQAEADAQRKMDKKIADLCRDVTHPITGKPITTFAEYEDAINAQNRIQTERALEESGLDISILDEYVKASPVLAQAQQIIEQNNMAQAEAQIKSDFEMLQSLNPDLKTFNDIENLNLVVEKVGLGMSLVDAYKIVNFDSLMQRGTKSAKQSAINQAKGKTHLEPTESISESNGEVEIPEELIPMLKETFPDKTMKEIKKLYNQVYKE